MRNHLLRALHVNIQYDILSLRQAAADLTAERAVVVGEHRRILDELIVFDAARKFLFTDEVVFAPVFLARTGRTGRCADGENQRIVMRHQFLDDGAFPGAGRAGNDQQHTLSCFTHVAIPLHAGITPHFESVRAFFQSRS